ncbi:DUF3500 domain-containing protein [Flavobacteriaceae bacterium F89]|uniref:DUF3500 domain-containing protein n=1 Tax=Cerina litoralis TaxID=2874477 RepID=A0AAE3JP67_9FLAO|nr:DUF3500 domain-containing protein [Cerina litoralis]MCG2461820.1 DUF3500 domain-containing protein [Cerina litoralis]
MKNRPIILLIGGILFSTYALAQDLSEKANSFLNSLSPELRSKAEFPIADAERTNWHYTPVERKGPTFHDFDGEQTSAALGLLRASLSEEGYRKTEEIRQLELVLQEIEYDKLKMPDGSSMRDPLDYHFCIFGTPSPKEVWGWRFEGHHVSLNFTSADGSISSSTPSFLGSNPGIVPSGQEKGKEVLRMESQLGLQLVNSFSKDQLKRAKFSDEAPRDIITGNQRKVEFMEPKGIAYSELNGDQKSLFLELLHVYLDNYESRFSENFEEKITKAGIRNLHFAWAGGMQWGTGLYYCIQGPVLLIEYDNTQNHGNHVHTVVRDLTNDFGEDVLREHYEKDHQH